MILNLTLAEMNFYFENDLFHEKILCNLLHKIDLLSKTNLYYLSFILFFKRLFKAIECMGLSSLYLLFYL